MFSNDIKKDMKIKLTHNRDGWMRDNKKCIARIVEVNFDVGSTYVDEIIKVEVNGVWENVEITTAHTKKLNQLKSMGW